MKYTEYLEGVNRTWKKADGLQELLHCQLAIVEELGEISGCYKKHLGYGRPKDEAWKTKLKGEFGDLIFYLTKIADITGQSSRVEHLYEITHPNMKDADVNILGFVSHTMTQALVFINHGISSKEFGDSLELLIESAVLLMSYEGWSLTEIQEANQRKLGVRHKDGFDDKKIIDEERDLKAEDAAVNG